jgi:F420-dependent oxidoreductase-like protein
MVNMTSFGLQIPNFTFGVPDDQLFDKVVELATAAEDVGFESVWVMDHFYQLPPLGGPDQPMLEAYTLLGALAASTTKVKLGTLVTGVTYRNPAMLAKIITTLDVISKGRAILGIGAAWYDVEHEGMGFDFPAVKERMDRLEEAVQICRAMFRDDHASFDGKHYSIKDARNLPRPIQEGGPEIMIGGGGEKRTLKLVAQYADMCNVVGDPAGMRHKIDVIQRHCKDVGRDPTDVKITRMATMIITDSPEQTAQTREFLTAAAGAEAAAAFTFGQEDEVVAQIDELIDVGVDTFIFNMPTSDAAGVRRAGELLINRFG